MLICVVRVKGVGVGWSRGGGTSSGLITPLPLLSFHILYHTNSNHEHSANVFGCLINSSYWSSKVKLHGTVLEWNLPIPMRSSQLKLVQQRKKRRRKKCIASCMGCECARWYISLLNLCHCDRAELKTCYEEHIFAFANNVEFRTRTGCMLLENSLSIIHEIG